MTNPNSVYIREGRKYLPSFRFCDTDILRWPLVLFLKLIAAQKVCRPTPV